MSEKKRFRKKFKRVFKEIDYLRDKIYNLTFASNKTKN